MDSFCHRCQRRLPAPDQACPQCTLSSALEVGLGDDSGPAEGVGDPRIGTRVAGYTVDRLLGQGGMGQVYSATQDRLGRPVALKFLPLAYLEHPGRRARLVHEAKTTSALNHPNIVTIHDLVEHDGQDVLVMERISGETLAERLQAGPLPPDKALRIAVQMVDGLAAAHAAGIVHRDLKPSNIMLTEDDRVKLVDFGLAKEIPGAHLDTETRTLQQLTGVGVVVGTASYMSPEQARGEAVGAATDVFATGVVLYEMLSGRRPFEHSDRVELLHQICTEEPAHFESASAPRIAAALDELLQDMLRKDPGARPTPIEILRPRLREVLAELGASTAGRTLLSLTDVRSLDRGEGNRRSAVSRSRSPKLGWVLAAILAAGGLMALATWIVGGGLADGAAGGSAESTLAGSATPFDEYRAGSDFLDRYYLEGYLDRAIEHLERAVAVTTDNANYFATLAEAYWRRFQDSRDEVWIQRARAHASQALLIDGNSVPGKVISGHLALEDGQAEEARRHFERAAQLAPLDATAHHGLARVLFRESRLEEAEVEYRRAIDLAPNAATLRGHLGVFFYGQSRFEEAAREFESSLALDSDYLPSHRNLAATYHMLGRFQEAASSLQRAVDLRADPVSYSNLGTLYFFQGLYPQAIVAFERATELSPNTWEYWGNLGDAYRWSADRKAEARGAYITALDIFEERPQNREGSADRSRLALLLAKAGESRRARLEMQELQRDADSMDAAMHYRSALTHELLGDREAALGALRQALDAGYSREELRQDPELVELRSDRRYRALISSQ